MVDFSFRLSPSFIDQYKEREPEWGWKDEAGNSIGELTFVRTYSRVKEDGTKEKWWEVCQRVIEGVYSIQKDHCLANRLEWNGNKAQASAQEAYERMFSFKWTPPGRGISQMGTPLVMQHKNVASLLNCAFVSSGDMERHDPGYVFAWMTEALMLGIGVGFDTLGSSKLESWISNPTNEVETYVIPDTREGWAISVGKLINSYLKPNKPRIEFDYSEIRPYGEPIKTFGGTASGPDPLIDGHEKLRGVLDEVLRGEASGSTCITNLANIIGGFVVAGNVRRSAELALGQPDDTDFINLKNPEVFPNRPWAYMSNNSISATVGMDYSPFVANTSMNGEPGYVWLDTARNFGRLVDGPDYKDRRVKGFNPCVEQPLESFEMCVSGDTRIHTRNGVFPIESLVGKAVDVWNGENWSQVTPFSTGRNSLYRVTLSDGSILDATPGHEWSVKKWDNFFKVQTRDLVPGMKLEQFSLGEVEGTREKNAYAYGWVAGDGYIGTAGTHQYVMGLVKTSELDAVAHLGGTLYKEQHFNNGSEVTFHRINLSKQVPVESASIMRKEHRLPEECWSWDSDSVLEFIAGLIDTDGSIRNKGITGEHYAIFGSESLLREVQILARRGGIDSTSLSLMSPKGFKTNVGERNQDLWVLRISSKDSARIPTIVKKASNFSSGLKVNPAHPEGAPISIRKYQRIVSVELLVEDADTYCFEEKEHHKGVFGNVLTHQCCLVEVHLNRAESKEDFLRTLKFAYLYGKTVTLLTSPWEKTNAVMLRNRRIGLSTTGVAGFVEENSLAVYRDFANSGFKTISDLDVEYSEWLGIRESIRKTTVKPSGSVSLLSGATPGVHWAPGGEYFLRAIRFGAHDQTWEMLEIAGYKVEDDVYSPNTKVVYFPLHSTSGRAEQDVSIYEKIHLAAEAQKYWSDNGVSVTVSFRKDEADDVAKTLRMYEGQLKAVSYLPSSNDTYAQMPYQRITQEEYERESSGLYRLDSSALYGIGHDEALGEAYCTTDSCMVPGAV